MGGNFGRDGVRRGIDANCGGSDGRSGGSKGSCNGSELRRTSGLENVRAPGKDELSLRRSSAPVVVRTKSCTAGGCRPK